MVITFHNYDGFFLLGLLLCRSLAFGLLVLLKRVNEQRIILFLSFFLFDLIFVKPRSTLSASALLDPHLEMGVVFPVGVCEEH